MDSVTWSDICASKALVFGLKRYSFRREYTASKLAAVGFTNLEVVDAFDGHHDDVDGALEALGIRVRPTLGRGHKGCCQTHYAAWKQMIDDDVPFRVFFEDDVIPHLDIRKLGEEFWNATPKDFDMLYLGSMMNPAEEQMKSSQKHILQLPTYTTHAYILSRKGAIRLMELCKTSVLQMIDIQLVCWQDQKQLVWYCWNGTTQQKSYPTYTDDLPWKMFPDVIVPLKDSGLFWQNMRVGTTLEPELLVPMPPASYA
jgi:GR25 family glycosyltransferase involved in LPS biosynthesis